MIRIYSSQLSSEFMKLRSMYIAGKRWLAARRAIATLVDRQRAGGVVRDRAEPMGLVSSAQVEGECSTARGF